MKVRRSHISQVAQSLRDELLFYPIHLSNCRRKKFLQDEKKKFIEICVPGLFGDFLKAIMDRRRYKQFYFLIPHYA